jgi:hypothetical protein
MRRSTAADYEENAGKQYSTSERAELSNASLSSGNDIQRPSQVRITESLSGENDIHSTCQ